MRKNPQKSERASTRGRRRLPARYLALGIFWASVPVFNARNLVTPGFLDENQLLFYGSWAGFFLLYSASHFILYAKREQAVPLYRQRNLLWASTACMVAGSVLCACAGAGILPAPFYCAGMCVIGLGAAPVAMSCGELIGVIESKDTALVISASIVVTALGIALQAVMGLLSFWSGALVTACFPVLAVLASQASWRGAASPPEHRQLLEQETARASLPFPVRVLSGLVVYGIAIGLMLPFGMLATQTEQTGYLLFAMGVFLAACPLFLIIRSTSIRVDFAFLYRLVLPMVSGVLLIATVFGNDVPHAFITIIVAVGFGYQLVLSIALSGELVRHIPVPGMVAFCKMAAYHTFGFGLGILIWTVLYGRGVLDGQGSAIVATVAILVLIMAGVFLLNEPSGRSVWGLIPAKPLVTNEPHEDFSKEKIEPLGKSYHLTDREIEVLLLLARGRTAQVIAKEFVVSLNTTKTHIKRIYSKMGVHSQQELIDLVNAFTPSK